ncbi:MULTISPECIES: hypothetical protein [Myxococcus]|uniref:hypothetical protein n=1 Tax=Myxococcus TaxID=32 RepID=UPI0013D4F642|nr:MULTISPECIES: hypothetical protein [Myxococcus]NVJ25616.1 hypothetical protein [Myxococcus sp. AM011]
MNLQRFRAAEPEEQFGIPTPPDDDVLSPGGPVGEDGAVVRNLLTPWSRVLTSWR